MKNWKRIFAVTLVAALLLSLCACGSKGEIKKTLSEFEYACKNLDLNAMLNCIDPTVAKPVQIGLAIYGMVTDNNVEDMLDDLVELVFGENYESSDFLSKLSIIDPDINRSGNTANVECKISFELSGQEFEKEATIKLVEKEDVWYISGISLEKTKL